MKLKTVNIKGKEYVMVHERIKAFRENYPGWSLTSEIFSIDESTVTIKALIYDNEGTLRATGHAQEEKKNGNINRTSFVENCETSAWGRALGNLGIGIDTSIASAEEVNKTGLSSQEVQELFLDCVKILGSAEKVYKEIDMTKKEVTDVFKSGEGLDGLYSQLIMVKS